MSQIFEYDDTIKCIISALELLQNIMSNMVMINALYLSNCISNHCLINDTIALYKLYLKKIKCLTSDDNITFCFTIPSNDCYHNGDLVLTPHGLYEFKVEQIQVYTKISVCTKIKKEFVKIYNHTKSKPIGKNTYKIAKRYKYDLSDIDKYDKIRLFNIDMLKLLKIYKNMLNNDNTV